MAKSIPKVSGMDWVIDNLKQSPLEEDEFTSEMVAEKLKTSANSIRQRLQRMFENGEVTRRKILHSGRYVNVYKRVIVTS
jgi:predicted transcriptional regulator